MVGGVGDQLVEEGEGRFLLVESRCGLKAKKKPQLVTGHDAEASIINQ